MTLALESVGRRLRRERPELRDASPEDRMTEIQLALLDVPGADPDSPAQIAAVERALEPRARARVLPRIKDLTGVSDKTLAGLIGKARPTVQAYISGRIDENLDEDARRALAQLVRDKLAEVESLIDDLEGK